METKHTTIAHYNRAGKFTIAMTVGNRYRNLLNGEDCTLLEHLRAGVARVRYDDGSTGGAVLDNLTDAGSLKAPANPDGVDVEAIR